MHTRVYVRVQAPIELQGSTLAGTAQQSVSVKIMV